MAAATVDDLSVGRFILAVGSSHKVQVEPEHGVPYAKPLTRVRESVAVIRALLRDGRAGYAGETVRIEFTADNPGRWFFHCHNVYHLEAGMAREFVYTT